MDARGVEGRVSVVTPVYNGAGHVGRLLESVLAQTWDEVEMILVDDGSEDATVAVAEGYRERFRARGYRFEIVAAEHRNASAAINRGLPLVTGEFLIWPDSDDALHPDSIRKRASFLRENPRYQCVRSLSEYRREDGSSAPPQEQRGDPENEALFFPVLRGEDFVCCGCYMLRCAAFFAIYPQRRIPEYGVGQNFQMLLPFLYRHRCPTLREALYTVYVRPDSHSRRALSREEDEEKYADFERLVTELAALCKITDPGELEEIEGWKQRRRYELSLRYGQRAGAARALWWLCRHGRVRPKEAVKGAVKILLGRDHLRRQPPPRLPE